MSATVTLSAEQRAQTRTRILQILLTEQAVSDGLLGRLDDPQLLNDPQLLDDSAEIRQAARTLPADDLSDILCRQLLEDSAEIRQAARTLPAD
ncbi:MAG: hypothetical protein ACRCR0_00230, partial [Edwardsiella piscicida]